jgi:P-type conjugative transfer protein TrbL
MPPDSFQFFQDTLTQFANIIGQWQVQIFGLGTPIFWALAFIEVGLIGALAILRHDATAIVDDLVRVVIAIGVAFWLFQNGADFAKNGVVATLAVWGSMAGGVPADSLDPGSVMQNGFTLAVTLLKALASGHWLLMPVSDVMVLVCAIVISLCFAWTAITLLEVLIESYVACVGGTIFIPLAAMRFSYRFLEVWISWVISVSVRLWFTYAILGVGIHLVGIWTAQIQSNASLITGNLVFPIETAIEAGIFVMMITRIPTHAGRLVSGAVTSAFGEAMLGKTAAAAAQAAPQVAGAAARAVGQTVGDIGRTVNSMLLS